MSHEVIWTKFVLERFIELGNLTREEEMIMRTRASGMTITEQSMMFDMSPASVSRVIRRLKDKYDECQKNDLLLPKRKTSEKERYMDSH